MAASAKVDWHSGVCDCFENASTCCYGFWCCPCLTCTVAGQFGESRCLPVCDILTPAAFTGCGIPMFAPPAGVSMRAAMRNRYNIKGSLCNDIVVACLCPWCSWCQMHREIKHRKKNHTTIINVQPAPIMMAPVSAAPVVVVNNNK